MFWRWNSEMEYMDCEWGQAASQTDKLDQLLFQITLWGDYHGSSIERFHYEYLLENAPTAVQSIQIGHGGQGLILSRHQTSAAPGELKLVMEVIAAMGRTPDYSPDYPIYDDGEYSDWEWQAIETEVMGYAGEAFMADLSDSLAKITDWDGIIPEVGGAEFWGLYEEITENESPYFESATDIVLPHYDADEIVAALLNNYANKFLVGQTEKLF